MTPAAEAENEETVVQDESTQNESNSEKETTVEDNKESSDSAESVNTTEKDEKPAEEETGDRQVVFIPTRRIRKSNCFWYLLTR